MSAERLDFRRSLALVGFAFEDAARALPEDRPPAEIAHEDLFAASVRFNRTIWPADVAALEYAATAIAVAICRETNETPRSFFERKFTLAPEDAQWWDLRRG